MIYDDAGWDVIDHTEYTGRQDGVLYTLRICRLKLQPHRMFVQWRNYIDKTISWTTFDPWHWLFFGNTENLTEVELPPNHLLVDASRFRSTGKKFDLQVKSD